MGEPPPIVFFGASGHALTIRDLMRRTTTLEPLYRVVAYIDDFRGDAGLLIDGAPVISFHRWRAELRDVPCLITLGNPKARRAVAARLIEAGALLPAVYDRAELGDAIVGDGSSISCGLQFPPGTVVGAFTHVLPFVSLSPRTHLGNFVTLCPHVTIAGSVRVEDGTFVGGGAKVYGDERSSLRVGRDVHVAAGTVVRESVADGRRVYGDPARQIAGMHVIR